MSTETTTAISLSDTEAQWMVERLTMIKEALPKKEAEYGPMVAGSPLQTVMKEFITSETAMVNAILEKLQPKPQHITETADFKGFM